MALRELGEGAWRKKMFGPIFCDEAQDFSEALNEI
jgi:hypothetical protein